MREEIENFLNKVEVDYGYVPGALQDNQIDIYNMIEVDLKNLIKYELIKMYSMNGSIDLSKMINELESI